MHRYDKPGMSPRALRAMFILALIEFSIVTIIMLLQ